eukprot:COSAG04_NODE_838_length_9963_cov_6.375912_8_plen_83_part_00
MVRRGKTFTSSRALLSVIAFAVRLQKRSRRVVRYSDFSLSPRWYEEKLSDLLKTSQDVRHVGEKATELRDLRVAARLLIQAG